jgi:hypothetical protein
MLSQCINNNKWGEVRIFAKLCITLIVGNQEMDLREFRLCTKSIIACGKNAKPSNNKGATITPQ